MATIELSNVTKRWGSFYAVDHLDLRIEDNAFVTLLGPSGCGKTTTLRMIAGLETPTSGRIAIDGVTVFDSEAGINISANKRKVGFLFQNYALWPNMTVYQNISFGLSNIKEQKETIDFDAKNTARLIEILEKPLEVRQAILECSGKSGKADEGRALLRLIDLYEISQYTARALLGFKLHESPDPAGAAKGRREELQLHLQELREKYKAQGQALDEAFRVTENGRIKTSLRKLTKEEIDLIVRRVSRIVKIGMFMDRYPSELSGGQQQRVAIARTLAPDPKVLFMDEPLSNLDAKLRLEMRSELQRLHLETGSTFVYVTHDQMEAMTLATKICLMSNGVLQQYDEPLTVYNRPANLFAADFVGNPAVNFIEASGHQEADGGIALTLLAGRRACFRPACGVDLPRWQQETRQALTEQAAQEKKLRSVEKGNKDVPFSFHIARVKEETLPAEEKAVTENDFVLGVRPEFIAIGDTGDLEGEIFSAMPTGMETTVKVRIGDFLLTGVVFGGVTYRIGQKVSLRFTTQSLMLFSRENGRLITLGGLEIE